MRRVVITGEGIVSAIGCDKASVLKSLQEGRTGIGEMKHLRSSHHELPVGEVDLSNDEMRQMLGIGPEVLISRSSLMGLIAIRQAMEDSGEWRVESGKFATAIPEAEKVILVSGTTVGGMDLTEEYFDSFEESDDHLDCLRIHDCGSNTRQMAEMMGFADCATLSTACSSAANALILGANLIKTGQADVVVAGGTEALTRFHLNGFHALMILDEQRCRPFDEGRAGLNLGEGAAFVVMESEEHARQRGAEIHAWLSGYGNACDAFHQTASSENGEGAYLAMKEALEMAQLDPSQIDYVNAHGTGTPNNDASESIALKRVFDKQMPLVSSTKGFTGHTTSASGSIEAVICLLAMQHHFVPANLGWQHQMSEGITPTMGERDCKVEHVMCNSFGFGGNDSALIFSTDSASDISHSTFHIPHSTIKELARVEITSEDQLSEIREYVKPLEARRMGKIMKSALLSSLKALKQAGIETPDAIITATSLGCLEFSENLLRQLSENGEQMLSPTWFMQSTHNTIGSAIAIRTQCHGYNVTYTQEERSLEWALRDARMLLETGKAKTVLVGLHEERTPLWNSLWSRRIANSTEQVIIPLSSQFLRPFGSKRPMVERSVLSSPADYNIHSIAMILTCGE